MLRFLYAGTADDYVDGSVLQLADKSDIPDLKREVSFPWGRSQ